MHILRILCVGLHITLVALACLLVIVWACRLERRVTFPRETLDSYLLFVQAFLQVFNVVSGTLVLSTLVFLLIDKFFVGLHGRNGRFNAAGCDEDSPLSIPIFNYHS